MLLNNYMLHHGCILRVFIINFLIMYSHIQTEPIGQNKAVATYCFLKLSINDKALRIDDITDICILPSSYLFRTQCTKFVVSVISLLVHNKTKHDRQLTPTTDTIRIPFRLSEVQNIGILCSNLVSQSLLD